MNRPKTPRRALSLRIREDLVEILEETAEELVVGRNRLVELALEHYFASIELPSRTIEVVETGERVPHPPTCGACHGRGCPIVKPARPLRSFLS